MNWAANALIGRDGSGGRAGSGRLEALLYGCPLIQGAGRQKPVPSCLTELLCLRPLTARWTWEDNAGFDVLRGLWRHRTHHERHEGGARAVLGQLQPILHGAVKEDCRVRNQSLSLCVNEPVKRAPPPPPIPALSADLGSVFGKIRASCPATCRGSAAVRQDKVALDLGTLRALFSAGEVPSCLKLADS